ncbi:DUF4365 domain-containing protein [Beijerinckia indica]|uniref:DUF4365 domain-containing protein n=1 Tax=Beijerinckia indica subsp. indica (strain ATCC 9039 / DSM 1715 / NCIMB 8712) TaxID=395963 RepID=B2ILA9_BEII9|nr:DUF4365 domain-containing protein [Beijerinckia indica]ACB97309.1 conserved hypothetical protein [Beijerinckia indica subsp. indica ATCC 9039]
MAKKITDSQLIGELGEAAVRKRFLSMGFQFDLRGRLEAGIDGIAEIMIEGEPTARMIAVQVKSTRAGTYTSETDSGFSYLLNSKDLYYWRTSNLPVILVLYRESDETLFWRPISSQPGVEQRRVTFDKATDALDKAAVDRLAQLTVPKNGFGYYVPPLGGGETALVNLLPIVLPTEMFVASTPLDSKRAIAKLHDQDDPTRFDWTIKGGTFWSFHDPREAVTSAIVDLDQVEAIETCLLAFHEDIDEQHNFAFLLRQTLQHQMRDDLAWDKEGKLFYIRALHENQGRTFHYQSAKNKTHADVVTVAMQPKDPQKVSYVRHHAFVPKFEGMLDQWFLMVSPTYHFTTNGFHRHSHPHALLSGKKRLDNNASLRGQLIMWHRLLSLRDQEQSGLFASEDDGEPPILRFEAPPEIDLPTTVPEDAWGKPKTKIEEPDNQVGLLFDEV